VQHASGIRSNLHSVTFVKPFSIIGVVASNPKPAAPGAKVVAPRGVLLLSVDAGSPADKAGLKAGDYIAAVNGRPVKTVDECVAEVSVLKPGTEAEVTYIRDHKEETVKVITADGSMPGAPH
jgi:S1-C subfamily serine protease